MRKILFGLFILSCIITASCKKGDVGAKGDTGEQGIQGIKGSDGSTILSGTGAPSATIGSVGDYYIDLSTANFYGAKTAQGWGNPISLKGATGQKGADGTNGTKILAGSGAPSNSLGNIGDFYLDTVGVVFYGPKISAADWGNQLSLRNDSTAVKTYFITVGFDSIQLSSRVRNYQTTYWYDGQLKSKVDSLNTYQYTYTANSNMIVSKFITNFNYVFQNGIIFIDAQVLPEYNTSDGNDNFSNQYGDGLGFPDGKINDTTQFTASGSYDKDTIFINGTLYANADPYNNVPLNNPPNVPFTGNIVTISGNGRPADYNADEFRNKPFYKIKLLVIPPSAVINLSAKGVNIHDKNAVKRALKL